MIANWSVEEFILSSTVHGGLEEWAMGNGGYIKDRLAGEDAPLLGGHGGGQRSFWDAGSLPSRATDSAVHLLVHWQRNEHIRHTA